MKWIQRGRRQKMGPPLESSPPISSVPSISPPPFQPVLALFISLWLHTISDEERLEKLSNREYSSLLPIQRSSPSMMFPTWNNSTSPHLSSCAPHTNEPLPSRISPFSIMAQCVTLPAYVTGCSHGKHLSFLFTCPPSPLVWLRFLTASAPRTCCQSDVLPESRRLRAQISWCIFQS